MNSKIPTDSPNDIFRTIFRGINLFEDTNLSDLIVWAENNNNNDDLVTWNKSELFENVYPSARSKFSLDKIIKIKLSWHCANKVP